MSRLRWLNSRIGEGETPVAPYKALTCDREARQITATEKVVTLGGNGLPKSIKVGAREVLKAPLRFVVETADGTTEFGGENLTLMPQTPGRIRWFARARKRGISFALTAQMEFDGFIRYFVDVQTEKTMTVKDVRLETAYTPEASEYMMGIGYRGRDGGLSPKAYVWNWKGPYDSYWMGGPNAGLHVEFRGGTYHGPLIADVSYHPAPPPAWANGGKGTISVGGEEGLTVAAHTGEVTLAPEKRTWAFDLLVTPVKPVDVKRQFSQRYYHAAPEGFPAAATRGANIANIHHAQSLNPVINYPFVVQEPLKKYIDEQHAQGRKVKLYYTIRELSNHVAELQALRSLGGEVIAPGRAHGAPWLWEHMGENYRPAWYVRLSDRGVKVGEVAGVVDAAFVLSPHSRWINYYLEGLRWMFENYRIDGIYMDDVSFDRTVMKRMRRIIEQYRPGALIDLHSNTGYSKGPANQYTDFFPYVDRLWFGESFQYNAMTPDTWFVTFSGIPFGLMGEMLQGGGNPWLGTVYGTTRRYYGAVTENNPTAIWKAWSDFGIEEAKMAGYWEKNPAVATDSPDVKATAFIRPGKTLVAVLPSYLNALEGKGVHVVTVNDYLAARDAEWMGQVHRFLGLSVGCILNQMPNDERRKAYECDITYGTNNEFGFDYLRDNMVVYKEQMVQRGLHYAIIDEVDSVLIDEARTPLIISGRSGKSTSLYKQADLLASRMKKGRVIGDTSKIAQIMQEEVQEEGDFLVDEKDKSCQLTAEGVRKAEEYFRIANLGDPENAEIAYHIRQALKARYLMARDKDYVVKEGQIVIVDEFTGRLMPGRRYSDGLHQAIEAKENVEVKRESKTLATITFQNFFNKYEKKAGMTGTAKTEENEFEAIYSMDVVEIPTNKPVIREDLPDIVYRTKKEKYSAAIRDIVDCYHRGQPVLVGTITIEDSELLSRQLKREGVPHNVLNAKFHEREAAIVAEAGQRGAVTIATNMAGRGTDIKLGEGVPELGGLNPAGSTTSCAAVPAVRATPVSPSSTSPWKTI